jgi:tRNA threonylcarbamoyladenosine biosynthesis protein TsaE
MQDFGARLGAKLSGGEVIELVGDIGAGKTTFTKGLARGLGVSDDVQSPTFTISRIYETPSGIRLAHYDFYRLQDAGVMQMELAESVCDPHTITVIECGGRCKLAIDAPQSVRILREELIERRKAGGDE